MPAPAADVARTLYALGTLLGLMGKFDESRAALEEAVLIHRQQSGAPSVELVSSLSELGAALHQTGDLNRARHVLDEAAALARAITTPSPGKVDVLVKLAQLVRFTADVVEAEALSREALSLAGRIYAPDHPVVAICQRELARALVQLARLEEAEPLARQSVASLRRIYGDRHSETMIGVRSLAGILRALGQLDESARLLREALDNARVVFGDGHPTTLASGRDLALVLDRQRRFPEALQVYRAGLASTIEAFGERNVYVAIALTALGNHYLAAGKPAEAVRDFRRAVEVRQQIHPAGHWRIDEARAKAGTALVDAGRYTEAESELLSAYQRLEAARGSAADETRAVRAQLVRLYERWKRPDQAARYRTDAR